jgi:hypothetical protein
MQPTPFPARPPEVVALTVTEFTSELKLSESVSFDVICHRFVDDINRALVWFIRFRALTAWCERADTEPWLHAQASHAERACALAASFDLNDDWQFDAERFRLAVEAVAPSGGAQNET